MGNLYERKDEVFRLVDVDGVVLTNPGDFIEIREPEGFDRAAIKLIREENHGFDFDFFDENSVLTFDRVFEEGETFNGYSLIDGIYQINGTDGKCLLQYIHTDIPETIYESEGIFSSRVKIDYGLTMRFKRTEFDDKFRNRISSDYDLNRDEDLDGNVITPISYSDIVLTPQVVKKFAETKKSGESDDFTPATLSRFGILNFGEIISNNFDNSIQTFSTQTVPGITNQTTPDQSILLKVNRFGFYTLNVSVSYDVRTNGDGTMVLWVDVVNPETQEIISSDILDQEPVVSGVQETVTITNVTSSVLWANRGNVIRVYLELDTLVSAEIEFLGTIEASLSLTANTKSTFLQSKYVPLIFAIQKTTEGITGVSNAVVSKFLNIQKAGLLTGKLVRGFPETNAFRVKWIDLKETLKSVFGCGFAIIRQETSTTILIDQYEDFYNGSEIMSFTEKVHDFEIETDKQYLANEIEIGYAEFSKGSNTVLLNNSNKDFLSIHNYVTPIIRDKQKLSFVSPITTSGYVIEEGRQQSFNRFPDEKWDQDEKLFLIALRDQDTVFDQIVKIDRFDINFGMGTPVYQGILTVQNALPHIGSATQITTIVGTFDIEAIPGSPFTNLISVDEERNITIIVIDSGNTELPYFQTDLTFDITWTAPETKEPFDVFNGIDDVNSVYNARYNIKNMLFNQSLLINSGLHFKPNTSKYRINKFENNADLETQFSIGENFSTLDPDRIQITQSDDLEKQQVNQGNQLFVPEKITFKTQLSFENIMFIRKALTNRLPYNLTVLDSTGFQIGETVNQTTGILASGLITQINGNIITVEEVTGKFVESETIEGDVSLSSSTITNIESQNYGFISVTSYEGISYPMLLDEVEYNPMTEIVKFTGKRKKVS